MPDARITDLNHLVTVGTRIQRQIEILTRQWIREDHAAYAPRGAGDTPGIDTDTGDPTSALADQRRKHRDRDRIGDRLLQVDADLVALTRSFETRTPARPCSCCRLELATHSADRHGNPVLCDPCDHHLRRRGIPCNDAIHEGRPRTRWCECPPTCCTQDADGATSCTDHAAEGRRVSERCRSRMRPERQATG